MFRKLLFTFLFLTFSISAAEAKNVIRDTEIENYIREYSKDIFISAGLSPDMIKIVIIEDDSPNAFVAGGMNIFIHTGLIDMCDTPEELIGVIAHETGHIAGGHLARIGDEMESARTNALYSLLLATAVGVASGNGEAGAAVLASGTEAAKRNLLHYSRIQESVADQNAFKYLEKSDISSEGLLRFLEKLEEQSLLPSSAQAEYLSTHPLSSNRMNAVKGNLENKEKTESRLNTKKFNIIKEKIKGYSSSRRVVHTYKNVEAFEKLYALAIAHYRIGEEKEALEIINKLIKEDKSNPYLKELKAQVLREFGDIEESIKEYKKAVTLDEAPLIMIEYARTMLDSGEEKYLKTVINTLSKALQEERQSITAWQLLSTAYKRDEQEALFRLSQAEADFLSYDLNKAKFNAQKAEEILKSEKKTCQRCKDIVSFIEQQKPKNKQ